MKTASAIDDILTRYIAHLESPDIEGLLEEPPIRYGNFYNNKLRLVKAIRKGLPFFFFAALRSAMPFTDQEWADFLNLSLKSLQRYQSEADFVFKPIHSEKILELAEVTQLGESIFDTSAQFYHWLHQSHIALGNMQPFELMKDSYGKELVIQELHRIDNGIFS